MRPLTVLCAALLVLTVGCTGADDADNDTSSACVAAFEEVAQVSSLEDSVEDYYPTLEACGDLSEWTAAAEASGVPIDTSTPGFTVANLCRGADEREAGAPLCAEAADADPLIGAVPPRQDVTLAGWRAANAAAVNRLQRAGVDANNSTSVDALSTACERVTSAIAEVLAIAPAPDAEAQDLVESALDSYTEAASACEAGRPLSDAESTAVRLVMSHGNDALSDLADHLNPSVPTPEPSTPAQVYGAAVVDAFTAAYEAQVLVTDVEATAAWEGLVRDLEAIEPPADAVEDHQRAVMLFTEMVRQRRGFTTCGEDGRCTGAGLSEGEDLRLAAIDALYAATGLDYDGLFAKVNG